MDFDGFNYGFPAQKGKKCRVLVVEDNEDNLFLLTLILQQYHCASITVKDGRTALSLAKKRMPDLILLDIVLPELNGLELTCLLKQDKATCKIPIVAITGLILPEDRLQINKAGCDQYLSKPYHLEAIEQCLDHYLQRKSFLGGDGRSPFKNGNYPSPSGFNARISEEISYLNLHPLL